MRSADLARLEAVEFAETESPRSAVHTMSVGMDARAKMTATDAFRPEERHVVRRSRIIVSGYSIASQQSGYQNPCVDDGADLQRGMYVL